MSIDNLVTMANQIGDFFKSYPDHEQAKKDIVTHIKRFWALRMRQQIVAHVHEHQGQGLHPIVTEAIKQHSAILS
ncbi:MAG TPA: formate dehydrogenase subunit delta [Methylophilaceae bacterium]|nr:formate dehydrogenase subunit delta [Methylophilaceae bacterium]